MTRASGTVLLALLLWGLVGCSNKALNFFFDIPEPTPAELAAKAEREKLEAAEARAAAARQAATAANLPPDSADAEPPAIESVTAWKQAVEMLPTDDLGEVDWNAALRDGTIRPRATIAGPGRPEDHLFRWDFFFPGPDPSMDAYFPHSAHTQWVDCASCHIKIFPYRELQITMDQILEGQYCGFCHGKVAFSLDNCFRCHLAMQ